MKSKTSLSKYCNPELVAEYARENPRCELRQWLPAADLAKVVQLERTNLRKGPEIHHIWHNAHHKFDLRSNIVRAGFVIHYSWGHGQNTLKLMILSLYAKWAKNDPAEFDLDELREAAGMNIIGWLDWKRSEFEVGSEWWKLATEMIEFQ